MISPKDSAPFSSYGRATLSIGLVLLSLTSQELGASAAVLLFPVVGPLGSVTLRLVFSSLILLLICRPKLRGRSWSDWRLLIAFALSVWGMNTIFYLSLQSVSLGVAVTLEMLGPLTLTVILSRRPITWLWVGAALAGVALLGLGAPVQLDLLGSILAIGAGAFWALYVFLSAKIGERFERLDGLALAMPLAAALSFVPGVLTAGSGIISPEGLLFGLTVALLSSALPYGFDMLALRRMRTSLYAVLMSLLPAVAVIIGFLMLGQQISLVQGVGVAVVIAASAGAVYSRV